MTCVYHVRTHTNDAVLCCAARNSAHHTLSMALTISLARLDLHPFA